MPTRKQRRRREKSKRHEYEYVYVDDEGHEVAVDPADAAPARPKKSETSGRGGRGQPSRRGGRPARQIQPASWSRVGKRGLIFAPLMLLTVWVLGGKSLSYTQRIVETAVLLVFFLPFSYVMDAMMYRAYRKRMGDTGADDGKRARR